MNLAQKIKALRDDRGWTQGDLAEKSGVGKSSIQLYESGKGNITQLNLEKIAAAFGINISYFINDKMSNSMSISQDNKVSISVHKSSISPKKSQNLQKLRTLIDEQENKIINLRFFPSVSAAAGYGANNDDESFEIIPITAKFLTKVLRVPVREYDVIKVFGDSMEPFLKDGDMVLVLHTHEASNGEIVIANINSDLYVKKLLRDPIKGRVRLTSMNELYDDIIIDKDELDQLQIVGVVKGKIGLNAPIVKSPTLTAL
ncbi:signal peptidase I [Campylobacter hyointestinalis]|uniref:XRE family transcriptional regulator n=1 Tax=Campylobacter hyointestinalis TaxID=198 RepID=UPI000728F956|nr:XRE family transcriptional regulator [Campylobacter hyointestinalis]CUU89016.1 signal peptidase I [Campylobacter hyointestinalis]